MGRGTQSQRETQHPQRLAVRSCFLSLVRQASCSPQTVIDVPGVCVGSQEAHKHLAGSERITERRLGSV